jgi:hypothetical protein
VASRTNIRELIGRLKSISPEEYNQSDDAACIAAHAVLMKGYMPSGDSGYCQNRNGREFRITTLAKRILGLAEIEALSLFNYPAGGWSDKNYERYEKSTTAAQRRDAVIAEIETYLRPPDTAQ